MHGPILYIDLWSKRSDVFKPFTDKSSGKKGKKGKKIGWTPELEEAFKAVEKLVV